jgi:type I restriction enzyme S subunit
MYQTIAETSQSTFPSFNKDVIENMAFPDVSLAEQQHIVDILGSIDDSIENNEFLIKKTNDFLADLFLKYSAKATDYKRLDEICSIITKGTTPTTLKRSFVDYGVPFVKVESLTDSHQIDTNKLAFIDTETHEMLQRSKLKYKDLLISIAGTIGRFGLVPKTMPQANTNQAVALVRGSIVSQEYLYALFLSGLCDEQIKAKTVQAVQANLSLSVIGSLSVPYILDNTFNKQINSLYEYIENLAEKNNKLYELKQLYLHKFFG